MRPDWFTLEAVDDLDPATVDNLAKDRLASRIQARVKATVDNVVSRDAALAGGSIVAKNDGGRIVIRSDDAAEVLRQSSEAAFGPSGDGSGDNAETPDDLFEQSSGIPRFSGDGSGQLLFRTISVDSIMRRQAAEQRDQAVERTVTDAVRMGIVDDFDDSVKDVKRGRAL